MTRRKDRVAMATVRVGPERGGQGVLVAGGFVVTATHCISWSSTGGMVLGSKYLEQIVTASGDKFSLSPWAVETVSDVALLGAPDSQGFPDDAEAFEDWQGRTRPVMLSKWMPLSDVQRRINMAKLSVCIRNRIPAEKMQRLIEQTIGIHVLAHTGEWIQGKATHYGLREQTGSVGLRTAVAIHRGTSGSPVVDSYGRLVGVISWGARDGSIPLVHQALPGWALSRIVKAERGPHPHG